MDPTAGIKAAELLIAELQRARSRKDKARIASRLLTEELEQIDARILVAKNSEPTSLPDVDDLLVAAWDQQREAVADLFDTATWETVKDAVTLPAQVVRQLKEQQASGEVAAQILEALHLANVGARSNLVAYASKDSFPDFLGRPLHDGRIDRRNETLDQA